MKKALAVEVLKPSKPAVIPKLKYGDDAGVAKHLILLFNDAQTGMRRIIALGLFAWHVKETLLKHGEWGAWLAGNCPELSREDSVTGKPKAAQALSNYMELTKGVLEKVGFSTIEKYHDAILKFPHGGNLTQGALLLLPDSKIPDEAKPLREKIFALVDGKTQNQLFWEFKQADDDGNTPKRGRLKGSSGLTKEQRERAAARAEEERINELEETILERNEWELEIADAKSLGMMDSKLLKKFIEVRETSVGFARRVLESRKEGGAK